MGEGNAGTLHGAEMEDVIFAGTAARPGLQQAEVALTLDGGSFPAPFADLAAVQVTRRIERGVGSVYQVNGRNARARDVQALFADLAGGAEPILRMLLLGAGCEDRWERPVGLWTEEVNLLIRCGSAFRGGMNRPAAPLTRRTLFVATTALGAANVMPAHAAGSGFLDAIEQTHGGRLGVFALDTATGKTLSYRPDERFLLQSTFKGILAAMVLSRVDAGLDDLAQLVTYSAKDLLPASSVTTAHVADGRLTVEDLCRAILEQSDNAAANLLLARVGGPESLTGYARRLGDTVTRFDRYELVKGWSNTLDTTTPRAIAGLAQTVVLGDALKPQSRALLKRWMMGNVVGRTRLRASLPADWEAGDRTGTSQGVCNDYAVAWAPDRAPLVMAAYYDAPALDTASQEIVLREVGSAIVAWAG